MCIYVYMYIYILAQQVDLPRRGRGGPIMSEVPLKCKGLVTDSKVQGPPAHNKKPPPQDHHRALGVGLL